MSCGFATTCGAPGQEELQKIPFREGIRRQREDLLRLMRQLSTWIKELDERIDEEMARREDALTRAIIALASADYGAAQTGWMASGQGPRGGDPETGRAEGSAQNSGR